MQKKLGWRAGLRAMTASAAMAGIIAATGAQAKDASAALSPEACAAQFDALSAMQAKVRHTTGSVRKAGQDYLNAKTDEFKADCVRPDQNVKAIVRNADLLLD